MKFTAEQITAIAILDVRDRQQRARVEALRILAERARRNGDGTENRQAAAVARLAEARLATPLDENAPRPYVSPLRTAQARTAVENGRPVPMSRSLSAVDLEWLRRLPSDAAKITPDDVRALAQMRVECRGDEDQRLLATVLAPIEKREEHLETAARVEVEKYQARPAPGLPRSCYHDLEAALAPIVAESAGPELTARDVEHRTRDLASDLAAIAS
jgi:hypothetical protein